MGSSGKHIDNRDTASSFHHLQTIPSSIAEHSTQQDQQTTTPAPSDSVSAADDRAHFCMHLRWNMW